LCARRCVPNEPIFVSHSLNRDIIFIQPNLTVKFSFLTLPNEQVWVESKRPATKIIILS
jgi:hypothetical protein